ncbi:MAG: hypothetical protein NXI16_17655 [Alphaproteobacteria bacterium]|nr:hypothetical protein [Alphaproteobacteria bacterium]
MTLIKPMIKGLFLLLLLSSDVTEGRAQTLGLGGGSEDGPLIVEADQGIEWIRSDQVYVARGNATASRGGTTVAADVLVARYRQRGGETQPAPADGTPLAGEGGTEIYRLEATGAVRIFTDREEVVGDEAVYDLDRKVVVVRGGDLRLTTPEDVITARDSLEYWQGEGYAVARGDAVAVRADRRIEADVLVARFKEGADGLAVSRMEATGGVRIATPNEVALGREGVYNLDTEIATLTGDVRITRGDNQLNGETAEVNLKTGVSRLLGRDEGNQRTQVRGLFVPEDAQSDDAQSDDGQSE